MRDYAISISSAIAYIALLTLLLMRAPGACIPPSRLFFKVKKKRYYSNSLNQTSTNLITLCLYVAKIREATVVLKGKSKLDRVPTF